MRWLDAHATATPLAEAVDARVAWLTGQSSWTHSALSPGQHAVLDDLAVAGWTPLRVGFPWTDRALAPYRREPLVRASARNAAQWAAARPGTAFTRETVRHLQTLLDRTRRDLLLLCGSTGARMIAVAAPRLVVPAGLHVRVVGLGPVGPLPPAGGPWTVHTVRGSADLLSRWGHRGPVDVVVPGGHLRAATSPEARAALARIAEGPGRGRVPDAVTSYAVTSYAVTSDAVTPDATSAGGASPPPWTATASPGEPDQRRDAS